MRLASRLGIGILGLWLFMVTPQAFANCKGCLCPGDPCRLCPLPPMQDDPVKPDEPELCARIRGKVPPTTAQPGSNEYFPSLDKSTIVCVSEGGDIIRNKLHNNPEFPSRVYCKPPASIKKH